MATLQQFNQLQAYARIDGTLTAVIWTISFAGFIGQFQYPLLGMAAFIAGAYSLIFAALRVKRFRDNIFGGSITYRGALAYSLITYMYASLLFAFIQFIYFQFIDHGYMMANYYDMVSTPEYKQAMVLYGLTESDLNLAMGNMAALRPIELSFQFLSMNTIMGLFVSIPVAAIIKKHIRKTTMRE